MGENTTKENKGEKTNLYKTRNTQKRILTRQVEKRVVCGKHVRNEEHIRAKL